jgi:hypothetical protein
VTTVGSDSEQLTNVVHDNMGWYSTDTTDD